MYGPAHTYTCTQHMLRCSNTCSCKREAGAEQSQTASAKKTRKRPQKDPYDVTAYPPYLAMQAPSPHSGMNMLTSHLDVQAEDWWEAQDAHLLPGRPRALAAAAHPAG